MKTNDAETQLREWVKTERANGLIGLKFFPGSSGDTLLRDAAEAVLKVAMGAVDCEDVTGQRI